MKSILDPSFCYTPSAATDIKKTFARIRYEHRREETARSTREHGKVEIPRVEPQPRAASRLRLV